MHCNTVNYLIRSGLGEYGWTSFGTVLLQCNIVGVLCLVRWYQDELTFGIYQDPHNQISKPRSLWIVGVVPWESLYAFWLWVSAMQHWEFLWKGRECFARLVLDWMCQPHAYSWRSEWGLNISIDTEHANLVWNTEDGSFRLVFANVENRCLAAWLCLDKRVGSTRGWRPKRNNPKSSPKLCFVGHQSSLWTPRNRPPNSKW